MIIESLGRERRLQCRLDPGLLFNLQALASHYNCKLSSMTLEKAFGQALSKACLDNLKLIELLEEAQEETDFLALRNQGLQLQLRQQEQANCALRQQLAGLRAQQQSLPNSAALASLVQQLEQQLSRVRAESLSKDQTCLAKYCSCEQRIKRSQEKLDLFQKEQQRKRKSIRCYYQFSLTVKDDSGLQQALLDQFIALAQSNEQLRQQLQRKRLDQTATIHHNSVHTQASRSCFQPSLSFSKEISLFLFPPSVSAGPLTNFLQRQSWIQVPSLRYGSLSFAKGAGLRHVLYDGLQPVKEARERQRGLTSSLGLKHALDEYQRILSASEIREDQCNERTA